jgi:hypothetical protein
VELTLQFRHLSANARASLVNGLLHIEVLEVYVRSRVDRGSLEIPFFSKRENLKDDSLIQVYLQMTRQGNGINV